MPLLLRLAWRELAADLRQGLAGFRLFLACLALGVAALSGIGSLSAAMERGLATGAATLLGGDLEFSLPDRDPPPQALAWLARHGALSDTRSLRAMVRRPDGTKPALVALKAVDAAYPLYGKAVLDPSGPPETVLATRDGVPGIALAPELLDRLQLRPGDLLRLGNAEFQIRARLLSEPDDSGFFALGPPALVLLDGLRRSGLDQPGTLATHAWRLRLPAGADPRAVLAAAERAFPDLDWQAREASTANPMLTGFIGQARSVLILVGLSALLLGGIGVAAAVSAHLERKRPTIAALKSLSLMTKNIAWMGKSKSDQ